jgi:hypothetical protein
MRVSPRVLAPAEVPGEAADPTPLGGERSRTAPVANILVFAVSIGAALALWELVSRGGLISQNDLPSMSTTVVELWSLMQTSDFWGAFFATVRGWALGLLLATALAGPGVNRTTSVRGTGRSTWTLTLRRGTYTYSSGARPSLTRTFRVT